MAETQNGPAAPANVTVTKPTTQAELSAAYPDLCAGLRTEGAAHERENPSPPPFSATGTDGMTTKGGNHR